MEKIAQYVKKYRSDAVFKNRVGLFIALGLNAAYALFKLGAGIILQSLWLVAFGVYYATLVGLRVSVAKSELKKNRSQQEEYSCYKKVGVMLLLMDLFITVVVLIIVNGEKLKSYDTIVAIMVATFTFYLMVSSIVALVKQRKYKSPLMSAAKMIGVVASLISMLSLTIIMLSTFSPEATEFNEVMIMASGGGFAVAIFGIGIYMVVRGAREMRG